MLKNNDYYILQCHIEIKTVILSNYSRYCLFQLADIKLEVGDMDKMFCHILWMDKIRRLTCLFNLIDYLNNETLATTAL